MKKTLPKKVLILGSGGLRIGQAGEFDYSGSQAIKALKEEGIKTVLINPNIATVQTDASMADELYLYPLQIEWVVKVIEKEKPDALFLGFGGQTALNLGLDLEREGILKKYNVKVLGTPVKSIEITEDRELFKKALDEIDVDTPKSISATTVDEALKAAKKIQYPVMMRSGFSLGGLGSGKINTEEELKIRAAEALHGAPQILIEEYLTGWKEIEYEIVRDSADNVVTVCNMENLDPMGVHTGESIVVAPSQTLTNAEYHSLREIAIKVARKMGIVGECNIQYALNPKTSEYRVIEMNARLSRSSALASKATGYPLAFVAAKLALGYKLYELKNSVTKNTSAFFEPALDYLVVKIPRWDIHKLKSADRHIGSEMKSVGEVMAIGRSFPETLQKALRMLNIGVSGLTDYPGVINDPEGEISRPTDRRIFALHRFFKNGGTVAEAHALSHIDPWFLSHIKSITDFEKQLKKDNLNLNLILEAKQLGFSDKTIAALQETKEETIRTFRLKNKITPVIKQIDTLAGEFPAETNYLYTTYHGTEHDIKPSKKRAAARPEPGRTGPLMIIGSGPYSIGSSVEFDWCSVNMARALRRRKIATVIINCNPETVSTDYDESDRLYFEELTAERVRDIADFEKTNGIVISTGGQIANNLAMPLQKNGYKIIGTNPNDIDRAENREVFSSLLHTLDIDQPPWERVSSVDKAKAFSRRVGYPVLVRPSYVLSGAAMNVVGNDEDLTSYIKAATNVSPDHPVVMSQFIENAKELEIDGVAENGLICMQTISEHVEHAGVHSGDASIVLPPQKLYLETIRRTKDIAKKIVAALKITGPFNIQFLAKENEIKVIECNVRASRSFPFVSKVTGYNLIELCVQSFLHENKKWPNFETLELDHVGVKMPQFSYARLKGADPVAHVEMASTGEVACIGNDYSQAFLLSWLATDQKLKGKRLLLSIGSDEKKGRFVPFIRELEKKGWDIYATEGTHAVLTKNGIGSRCLYKASDEMEPSALSVISDKKVDLIISTPRPNVPSASSDGFRIRRLAIDHHIPLITNVQIAQALLQCLAEINPEKIQIKSWKEFIKK